jgi:RNA polymerase sigma-70 factor (ECF subfamily)
MDIAQLVAEHHQAVYRYAFRLAGTAADAEDLTQQVFLTAQRKLRQLRKTDRVRSWLFTILRHRFLKAARRKRPIAAGSIELTVENIPAKVPAAEAIDREALQQAIDQLPALYRVVLTMFYYEDCSYREIAEKLEVPIGTVMSRLARAKGRLRSALFGSQSATHGRPVPVKANTRG